MFPQPWVPTQEFAIRCRTFRTNTSARNWRNWASLIIVEGIMWAGTENLVNEFRVNVLGLRKIRKGDAGRSLLLDWEVLHSSMWSKYVVPPPVDWDQPGTMSWAPSQTRAHHRSTLRRKRFNRSWTGLQLPNFVGFGSMIIPDAAATIQIIVDAAAGAHIALQSSWSDMTHGCLVHIPPNVFMLGN
ncbi:hypothetical protein DYB28_012690 [Aphanomyces astaci]|uniref:Uncharacterized protein n=1 Tax=Aphanomyces astaci TaxID=112090 RepID=A0A9X8HFM4_APHAT|nr:hypothetical protein DYB28_012690 [Aphanomyces astaci]